MRSILVIDDEASVRLSLSSVFEKDYRVLDAENGEEALGRLADESVDVAIVDLMMPGMSGLELLPRLKAADPRLTVVVLTAVEDIDSVVQAVQHGADRYLTKPFDVDEVKLVVEMALRDREKSTEISLLESEIARWYDPKKVVGESKPWTETVRLVHRAAESADTTIMLYGESGAGKELLARLTHDLSPRADAPMVPIHCAAIPETLLESEMFGHEKGSFTGATERRQGCVEMADGGSLFLDEIGEMPAPMQSKLLRFLEDHQFMRIGGRDCQQADVRIIAATNRNLHKGVEEGWFREDLYYRLNVVPITIPPLRERDGDVALLTEHFLERFRRERPVQMHAVSPEARLLLEKYHWPGNVRELRNLVERITVLHGDEDQLLPRHLPPEIHGGMQTSGPDTKPVRDLPLDLDDEVRKLEEKLIRKALTAAEGNLSQAAVLLQTTRRKLKYKMDQHELHASG